MAYRFVLALVAATAAFGQSVAFEVATIKPAGPLNPQAIMAGKMKIGETIDGARADYGYVNIEYLMTKAYGIKSYQVSGPTWITSERYDIVAKLPAGATKDQVPDMLKDLLKERFKIELHHDSKEHAVYALVVGKNGPKIKESEAEKPLAEGEQAPAGNAISVKQAGDGRSMSVKTSQGNMAMSPGADGQSMHMQASQMTIASFVEMITRFVDKPVIDQTDLKAKYDIAIDLSMSDIMNIARTAGVAIPGAPGGGGRGTGVGAADAASDPSGSSMFQAVQNLGLKLEPKKLPMDTFVIDKGEKVPTEN